MRHQGRRVFRRVLVFFMVGGGVLWFSLVSKDRLAFYVRCFGRSLENGILGFPMLP